MKKIITYLIFVLIGILLSSCGLNMFRGSHARRTYYESFYISDNVNQYFLKPLEFKFFKEKLFIDFTFRDSTLSSPVTTNYTVETHERTVKIDSAYFMVKSQKIPLKNSSKMFVDKKKDTYEIRYTNTIQFRELSEICKHSDKLTFVVFYNNEKHIFLPTKKTIRLLSAFYNDVIDVIYLNQNK